MVDHIGDQRAVMMLSERRRRNGLARVHVGTASKAYIMFFVITMSFPNIIYIEIYIEGLRARVCQCMQKPKKVHMHGDSKTSLRYFYSKNKRMKEQLLWLRSTVALDLIVRLLALYIISLLLLVVFFAKTKETSCCLLVLYAFLFGIEEDVVSLRDK